MLRQQPKPIPEDTDYCFCEAHLRHPVFSHPDEYAFLKTRPLVSLKPSSVFILGFCWRPDRSIHLARRIVGSTSNYSSVPVRYCMIFKEMRGQLITPRSHYRTHATAKTTETIHLEGDA